MRDMAMTFPASTCPQRVRTCSSLSLATTLVHVADYAPKTGCQPSQQPKLWTSWTEMPRDTCPPAFLTWTGP